MYYINLGILLNVIVSSYSLRMIFNSSASLKLEVLVCFFLDPVVLGSSSGGSGLGDSGKSSVVTFAILRFTSFFATKAFLAER